MSDRKRGRPPKADPLDARLTLRLRSAELARIDHAAALAGVSPSEYVRTRALGQAPGLALIRHRISRVMVKHPDARADLQSLLDAI